MALQDLAVDNETTFISATNELVEDTSSFHNQNQPVSGLQVETYTPDETPVNFLRFDLNLSSNSLTLYFDEPVEVATFDVRELSLLDLSNTSQLFSVDTAVIPTDNSHEVVVTLHQMDMNELNIIPVCSDENSCYINITAFLAVDTANNTLNVSADLPYRVAEFTPDTVSPRLDHFELFDLDEGELTLVFTESVLWRTVMPVQLNITDWFTSIGRSATIVPSGGTVNPVDGPRVTIQLLNEDLNQIKSSTTLCTSLL